MASDPGTPVSGRRRELALLQRLLDSSRPEFLALYGRRRVGKTYLIRSFFGQRAHLFEVTGRSEATMTQSLRVFADALGDTFYQGAELAAPTSWHDAFRALQREIERKRGVRARKKWVLFFDELPWLASHKSGCLEELGHFWNAWCSKQPNIIVIVCGSAASWMLRKIVHARGGLHNRLTAIVRLLPFTLREANALLVDRGIRFTRAQVLELYLSLGGVPHYLEKVPRGASAAQAIDALCFGEDGPLVGEFEHLFASLFTHDEAHRRIVETLARRRYGVPRTELLAAAGLGSGGTANRILANLEEAGFIRTTIPYGRAKRDRFYRLVDEFSIFHLSWMVRTSPRRGAYWSAVRGSPRWTAWSGLAFEAVCLRHVDDIEHALGISGVLTEVSSWQHRARDGEDAGAQIDLLIDRADGVISVCELKHTAAPFTITKRYAADLKRKLEVFRREAKVGKTIQLVMVATAGLVEDAYSREIVGRRIDIEAFFESWPLFA